MAANLTQILNFKANFHKEFELFSKKNYANNGGHFKIVRLSKNIKFVHIRAQASLMLYQKMATFYGF